MKWVINYQQGNFVEWDLVTDQFTIFRLMSDNGIVRGCPIYPNIINPTWYGALIGIPVEEVKSEIISQFK